MSSHWRLIISKGLFVPVKTSCTSFKGAGLVAVARATLREQVRAAEGE